MCPIVGYCNDYLVFHRRQPTGIMRNVGSGYLLFLGIYLDLWYVDATKFQGELEFLIFRFIVEGREYV